MAEQLKIKKVTKASLLKFQRLFPREICLITGAPRSGTSALSVWLGQQPGVAAFAESRILVSIHKFLVEALRFKNLERENLRITSLARQLVLDYYFNSRLLIGEKLVIDKEPLEPIAFPAKDYEPFISSVKQLLPDSRLLFAIRDPLATIWSMSRRTWGESLQNETARKFTIEEHTENWCACANLIARHCTDPKTYVVQFGNLVNDSENESKRIFSFLNIRHGITFQPQPTKEIGFSSEEQAKILTGVQPQLAQLKTQGITNL